MNNVERLLGRKLPKITGDVFLPEDESGLTRRELALVRKVVGKRKELKKARNVRRGRAYKLSQLKFMLFNATASTDSVDVVQLFNELTTSKPPGFISASLKGGQFKELARINSKSVIPLKSTGYRPNQIMITFDLGGKRNIVNVFSNGSLRLSGASDVDDVVKYTERLVGTVENVIISNTSGQLRIDKNISLDALRTHFPKELLGRDGGTIYYEKETGIRTLGLSYKYAAKYTRMVENKSVFRPAKVPVEQAVTEAIFGRKVPMKEEEYREKFFVITFYRTGAIQFRGKVADPGSMISFIKGILDAVQDYALVTPFVDEKPAAPKAEPKYTTRSRNPPNPPDSFEGTCAPGYYCRPNAQGFPSCYKIPEINASSRRTVAEAYRAAGVPIPDKVKALFGIIGPNSINYGVKLTLEKQKFRNREIEVLKIGGRQCFRMSEDQLEAVARRLEIPGIRKGMGVAKMCERLKRAAELQNTRQNAANFTVDGQKYYIMGNSIKGATRKNGKPNPSRKCATLPVEVLKRYARAYGIDPEGKSRPKICAEMAAKKGAAPQRARAAFTPAAPVAPVKPPVVRGPTRKESSDEKSRQHFIQSIGNVPYTNENIQQYINTPAGYKRAAFIMQHKKNHALTKSIRVNNIPETSRAQFMKNVVMFAKTKKGSRYPTAEQVSAYRNTLAAKYRNISGRNYGALGPGGAKTVVETM
jgi:hypothetical protein